MAFFIFHAEMPTHLFFDLDHTLWDFEANKNTVLRALWTEFPVGKEELFPLFCEAFDRHNEILWTGFRNGTILREDLRVKRFSRALLDLLIPDTGISEKLSTRFLQLLPQQTALLPFAKEILDYCKARKYPMAIITNGFDTTQQMKLRAAGIEGYFAHIFSSESCGQPKPHKDIFDLAQRESGVKHASACVMIGDSLEADISGALAAGWESVFYNPGKRPHNVQPTYEIGCLSELKGLL